MSGASVSLTDVRYSVAESNFSFDVAVQPGEIVAIMGSSGAGKSTLLNLIAGFEFPLSGRILIDGSDMTTKAPGERPVSMVFQENNLFAHLDVAANVGLGRSPSLHLNSKDRQKIQYALEKTGLLGKQGRLPSELSGGERQRVSLARVLVRDRPVLLLDEPFASLGPALRREMLELVHTLHETSGMTVFMASHHPDDAMAIAQRLLFIEEGRILADGDTGQLLGGNRPPEIANYLGKKPPE